MLSNKNPYLFLRSNIRNFQKWKIVLAFISNSTEKIVISMKKHVQFGKNKNSVLPKIETKFLSQQDTDLSIEEDDWESTDEWGFQIE